ncbi:T9SS type A sorting domain-containing protein [Kordia sp.]|uniref:T9SS type A sorting domain-containing protein n=1 Tax=Kordia sp. TaxID=1965332 RepID=UPI003D2A5E67
MKKLLLLFAFIFCIQYAQAIVYYVNPNATGNGSGFSWANAFPTIEDAFAASIVGDQVWVIQGVYKPQGNTRSSRFNIPNGVEVYGSFAGTETAVNQRDLVNGPTTTLNGDIGAQGVQTDNCWTVVRFTNSSNLTVFDGFRIINGYNNSSTWGGAIYNSGGQPTIRNCDMIANYGDEGGAFGNNTNDGFVTTLISCRITSNNANEGGGIYNESGIIRLIDCDISNNQANSGGGMHIQFDKAIVDRCIFSGNSASNVGGAITIDNTGTSLDMYNSLIVGNFANEEAAIATTQTFSNSDLSTIVNCTIASNRNVATSPNTSWTVTITNGSTFANNVIVNNIAGRIFLNGNASNCVVEGAYLANNETNITTVVPTFVNSQVPNAAPFIHNSFDYRLAANSASGIDTGDNSLLNPIYLLDLDGNNRIQNTTVDAGAYEDGTLSVDEFATDNTKIFPNPAKDHLNIKTEQNITKIDLFDVSGRKLSSATYTFENNRIDLINISAGMYLVKLYTASDASQTFKFIVTK